VLRLSFYNISISFDFLEVPFIIDVWLYARGDSFVESLVDAGIVHLGVIACSFQRLHEYLLHFKYYGYI
jgi:hypothetical protein